MTTQPNTNDADRAAFETWADSQSPSVNAERFKSFPDKYKYEYTNFLWNLWKAALLHARKNVPNWLPIDSAPKDGTEILGWRNDCGIILIRWTSCDAFMTDREMEQSDMDEETIFQQDWFCADFCVGSRLEGSEIPTHWHPLPPTKE